MNELDREIVVIAHDIRSTYNVGSLLRTAEGLAVKHIYFTGYTPYPKAEHDIRLPHIANKLDKQIHKSALDAEKLVNWSQTDDVSKLIDQLKADGFTLVALEQSTDSIRLPEYKPPLKIAILLGREVEGIEPDLIKKCDLTLEIPMFGQKESYNVVQATAICLYHCRFFGLS
ncbi:MAG: TrmH family RNA methyltransferase [Candidatus Saccharimonadales bacterium]